MPKELPEHLARLLTTAIETEERLDVLCLLRQSKPKTYSARAVAKELSIPLQRSESALAMLCGRGFLTVSIATDLFYSYAPVSPAIDSALEELTKLLERDRALVTKALAAPRASTPAHAFANAFLLRKKEDDDA